MRKLVFLTLCLGLLMVSCKPKDDNLHVFTFNATQVTLNTAVCGGTYEFDSDKVTDCGVCWSLSPEFADMHQQSATEIEDKTFRTTLSGLEKGETYYIYAYVVAGDEIIKGIEKNFTTLDGNASVTTTKPVLVNSNEIVSGGHLVTDGGFAIQHCGVTVSTNADPASDSNAHIVYADDNSTDFECHVYGLDIQTKYYVCAWAETEKGTFYGDVQSVTTTGEVVNGLNVAWADGLSNQRKQIIENMLMNMVRVEGGTFNMGAQSGNAEGTNYDADATPAENPVHQVTLSDYHIAKYQLTQKEMNAIMGESNDGLWNSQYGLGDNYPVYNLSYTDAMQLFSKLINLTKVAFWFPTEAQWEFAARGGNQSQGFKYSGSCVADDVAWHEGNSLSAMHEVGQKQANELGLYDMSGNVWEWCHDYFGMYEAQSQTNPSGLNDGTQFVVRGGSWMEESVNCRVSSRNSCLPTDQNVFTGIRLAINDGLVRK